MNHSEQLNTEKTSKTPSQDAQGRWDELISPTKILTGEETSKQNIDHQDEAVTKTTTVTTNKKKKCRGNRKAQRQRRNLRRQEEMKKKEDDKISSMEQDIPNTDEDLSDMHEDEEEQQMQVSF